MTSVNLYGPTIGLMTFLIIGVFHPLVIKGEYYLGVKCWILFLLGGIIFGLLSLFSASDFLSIVFGVICFSSLWGIVEVFAQRERVRKGWFPKNPKRKDK